MLFGPIRSKHSQTLSAARISRWHQNRWSPWQVLRFAQDDRELHSGLGGQHDPVILSAAISRRHQNRWLPWQVLRFARGDRVALTSSLQDLFELALELDERHGVVVVIRLATWAGSGAQRSASHRLRRCRCTVRRADAPGQGAGDRPRVGWAGGGRARARAGSGRYAGLTWGEGCDLRRQGSYSRRMTNSVTGLKVPCGTVRLSRHPNGPRMQGPSHRAGPQRAMQRAYPPATGARLVNGSEEIPCKVCRSLADRRRNDWAGPDLHRHSGGRAGQARRGPSARGRHLTRRRNRRGSAASSGARSER